MRKPGSASNSRVWSTLALPKKISSAAEFERCIVTIRKAYTGNGGRKRRLLDLTYYLLGWMVGDAGKNFHKRLYMARFTLDLSRKHSQNLPLGDFVMSCISMLGVPCGRIADSPPRKRDRYGQYRWLSYFSEVFAWLHTACLGLQPDQLTSYDPVKMDWLLTAPREAKLWFLRGIADSDGTVNARNRTVNIITEPNSGLIIALLQSLGVRTGTWVSKGVDVVSISAANAMNLRIFNPIVETHRGRLLQRIGDARTYRGRWPGWLHSKVDGLVAAGLDAVQIRDALLETDHTYVTLRTIKSRAMK